jgi:hypothetical protein
MIIHFTHRDTKYSADLSNGLDISIPLKSGALGPKCFYAPDFKVEPVIAGDFIGSIEQGSPVNFKIYWSIHTAMARIPNVLDTLPLNLLRSMDV